MNATSTLAVAAPQTSDECRVLIVDDDRDFADGLADFLNLHGYRAEVAYDADAALAGCERLEPGIAIFDIRLGVGSGLELMQQLQERRPELLSIAATGYANIETAIEAIRKGAYDYLRKPLHNDEILIVLERGFEKLRLEENKRTAEEALRLSEERFRDFAEASADWFWTTDAEHRFTDVSANFERLMGIPVASVLGRTRLQIRTDTGDEEAWRQHLETLRAHEPFRDFTFIRIADAGVAKWASTSGVPRFAENGEFLGYRGIGSDVTDLKQAEAALRAERTRLDTILDLAPDAIVVVDGEFRIRVFGQGAVRTFGYTADEALGQPIEILVPPQFRDRHRHHVQTFAAEATTTRTMNERGEIFGLRKNGGEFPAEASISKLELGDETLFTVILRDTTERKQREEQLRQSQKMEAIGQLTGGVAHDFNNLLAIIQGNIAYLDGKLDPASELKTLTEPALRAVKRGASLTRRLLAFSRRQTLDIKPVNAGELVIGLDEMLGRSLGEDISLKVEIEPELWDCEVDAGQLEQAIVNLANNARDALPGGGTLTISAANVQLSEIQAAQTADLAPGDYVVIKAADNGAGMSVETREKIFEPFFTTKELGKGTGLGLSMVYGFVQQSGGHVTVYSEPDLGTTVQLYLPRLTSKKTPPDAAQTTPPAGVRASGETVLLVEDDADLRAVTRMVLMEEGYRVLEASTGREALSLLETQAPIDLLLTDVVLPDGLSGPEAVRLARRNHPDLEVVYMSGYAGDAIARLRAHGENAPLLQKPFDDEELKRELRRVLDRRRD